MTTLLLISSKLNGKIHNDDHLLNKIETGFHASANILKKRITCIAIASESRDVEEAIKASPFVLVIVTPALLSSPYACAAVRFAYEECKRAHKYIIPVIGKKCDWEHVFPDLAKLRALPKKYSHMGAYVDGTVAELVETCIPHLGWA